MNVERSLPKPRLVGVKAPSVCPVCGGTIQQRDTRKRIVLDYVEGKIERITFWQGKFVCKDCKTYIYSAPTEMVPGRNYTKRYARHITEECMIMPISTVAENSSISEDTVKRVFVRTVQCGLKDRKLRVSGTTLAIYNFWLGAQKCYLFWDPDKSEPIELIKEDKNVLRGVVDQLSKNGLLLILISDFADQSLHDALEPLGYPVVTSPLQCYYAVFAQFRQDSMDMLGRGAKNITIQRLLQPNKNLSVSTRRAVSNLLRKHPPLSKRWTRVPPS